jgi:GNAT superfamily N-acetyltransferase
MRRFNEAVNLRLATKADIPDILRLISEFYVQTPYKTFDISSERVRKIAEGVTDGDKTENVIILALDDSGVPRGILGAAKIYPLLTDQEVAAELFLWVEPEYRKQRMGRWLMLALEEWARKTGCSHVQMAKMNGNRKKFGYTEAETVYLRKL